MVRTVYRILVFVFSVLLTFTGMFPGKSAGGRGTWLLEGVPEFGAGTYSTALYNTGTGLDQELPTEAEPEPDPVNSNMQLVSGVSLADLLAYCGKLEALGYRQTFFHQIENNTYFAYEKGEKRIYVWRSGNANEVRVADDCCNTVSLDAFGYTGRETEKTATPAVYQFSYPYRDADHPDEALYTGNGMLYVIVLSDRSVVVIDGGHRLQFAEQNVSEFWRFLHVVTGKKDDAKIRISLWYGTHIHLDHNAFFTKFLKRYHARVILDRCLFNFQADEVLPTVPAVRRLKSAVVKYYPDVKYVKARPGYAFTLQDARFEVLYTHEDQIDAENASWRMDNANDASTVVKVTLGGKTFLFLGDANRIVEETLRKNFTEETLGADVLQAAHHLYNDLQALYPVVSPTYVFAPQSKLRAQSGPMAAFETLGALVPAENFFFADAGICWGLIPENEGLRVTGVYVNCVPYDGSDF